jgi:hypothetical protein
VRLVQTAPVGPRRQEWSDWGERHGRLRREVAVERSGSCRDTMERLDIDHASQKLNLRELVTSHIPLEAKAHG